MAESYISLHSICAICIEDEAIDNCTEVFLIITMLMITIRTVHLHSTLLVADPGFPVVGGRGSVRGAWTSDAGAFQ